MIELIFIAFSAASFTDAFTDFIAKDMIFERYGNWLQKIGYWAKPIGGCMICTNVWVTVAFFTLSYYNLHLIWGVLATIGISNLLIKLIVKHG